MIMRCLECRMPISWGVHEFSQRIYGHSLCMRDQYLLEESGTTAHIIDLYLELKQRKFPVVLNYCDGFKQVDLAIPGKLYIEIGSIASRQRYNAMTEFAHSLHSREEKIPTVIIPNSLIENRRTFKHAVEELSKACNVILGRGSLLSSMIAVKAVQLQ